MKRLATALALPVLALAEQPESEKQAARQLRDLGVYVFIDLESGRPNNVSANGNDKITDADLKPLAELPMLTDLSFEQTEIGDAGLAHAAGLTRLEWLNLFRTKVTDAGLAHLARLENLQQLPIGETAVTDAGLPRIAKLKNLIYLGLRGNAITDAGVAELEGLTNLTGLHLGETKISDRALESVAKLKNLERLWLHDTAVTNDGVPQLLAALPKWRELHLQRTKLTIDVVKSLRKKFPECEIFYESDLVNPQSTESPSKPGPQP